MKSSENMHQEEGGRLTFVPVGSFEQHGPHLPFETDLIIAEAVASEAAKRLKARVGASIPVGVSPEHMDFPGTKTLSAEEFKSKVRELGGIGVVFINGHGGNNISLRELGVRHVNLTTMFKPYDHAGEIETSIIMHLRPELVKEEKICKHDFAWPKKDGWKMKDCCKTGVLGDPTKATAEKGGMYFNELVEKTLKELEK
jgi:creatinine amidohydrolase/Fe(II)-dependent formamide hydrolase-like protein